MSIKEVEFVLCHEILHNVFDHMGRYENRHKKIFNIAADYCVNGILIQDKIGDVPKETKPFHDTKYKGMCAEQVYDIIYKEYDEESLNKLGQLIDEHMEWDKDTGNGRPVYSKEELATIRDELYEATLQAAQAAGTVPGAIERLIRDITERKMNWRELLRQQIQSTVKNDYSFMRPNRKGWHTTAILPGTNYTDTIDIAVSIDLSGSISDKQCQDFLSEIKGIMEEYQDFQIKLWTFDTRVYNEETFNAYNMETFLDYKLKGGGGTNFQCNWDYMRENDIVPKRFIMFSDMYDFGSFGEESYCPTIFINHGRPGFEAPHGITVDYSELS
jgi:predicted metal-dependent peptidase